MSGDVLLDEEAPEQERAVGEVDVLFFQIGDSEYGTDASSVLRIDRALPEDLTVRDLGMPHKGHRALVFDTPEGEGHLKVDAVNGVRTIPVAGLRRMPAAAAAASYAVGICLDEEAGRPVLLIDLAETLKTQGRH
ncbi:Frizzy aggregation protein FrzB [Corallococcus exiguus]|uniref:Frizzy aggregation protein FrzB n=1 Tax=Corallococcus TaxID=83461 RepID=UPI000ED18379|nr:MULTISPECIES: Frizzy aggregation protein FrzB [Corallococcus]NNB87130.1 Frizzy aggregation protein FrzB [Corallococcus exiguus]NNB94681.1 Frizzy aggregation protein FrzB [Corallococcus exiguus]NNC03253.1 Frizzy aggregation protein FrzB [Corallococcus exiguus]NPC48037.1 Frizzy aggregation protein FrzB [Corallococcus exiguus]RKH82204.1 Frizzy aggregation protein FrzB [Corallococcus sp. AB032C]